MDEIIAGITDRGEAMNAIYKTGHYTMFEIAAYFYIHYSTVSRLIRSFKLYNYMLELISGHAHSHASSNRQAHRAVGCTCRGWATARLPRRSSGARCYSR
ncbi:hypothetical protein R2Q26_05390 [Nitrosomonas sp. Is37]|nr:hypothetical protein [Nitrosomonas sp. Is37]